MEKVFVGNENAFTLLENYIHMKHPGPLILQGKKGLGKRRAAEEAAAALLQCHKENLLHNPDFYILDKEQSSIKVEDILQLLERSRTAAVSRRKVYLICNAEKINAQGQNKLLKLLEDRNQNHILLLLCNQDILLETIKSRCCTISFTPFLLEELAPYFAQKGVAEEDMELMAYLCDFCPYELSYVSEFAPALKAAYSCLIQITAKEELFQVFHLIQEKDPENFYETHSSHFLSALHMLEYVFMNLLKDKAISDKTEEPAGQISTLYSLSHIINICSAISLHQNHCQAGSYTKNDFFDLIRIMAQEKE